MAPANTDADDVEPNKTLLKPNFSSDEDDGSFVTMTPPLFVEREEVLKEVLLVVVGVLVIMVDVAIVDDGVPTCSITNLYFLFYLIRLHERHIEIFRIY